MTGSGRSLATFNLPERVNQLCLLQVRELLIVQQPGQRAVLLFTKPTTGQDLTANQIQDRIIQFQNLCSDFFQGTGLPRFFWL